MFLSNVNQITEENISESESENDSFEEGEENEEENAAHIPLLYVDNKMVGIKRNKEKAMEKVVKMIGKKSGIPMIKMILKAIEELKERNGSSTQAIRKYIKNEFSNTTDQGLRIYFKKALLKGVAEGLIIQTKGNGALGYFKISMKNQQKKKKTVNKKSANKVTKMIEEKDVNKLEADIKTKKKTVIKTTKKSAKNNENANEKKKSEPNERVNSKKKPKMLNKAKSKLNEVMEPENKENAKVKAHNNSKNINALKKKRKSVVSTLAVGHGPAKKNKKIVKSKDLDTSNKTATNRKILRSKKSGKAVLPEKVDNEETEAQEMVKGKKAKVPTKRTQLLKFKNVKEKQLK